MPTSVTPRIGHLRQFFWFKAPFMYEHQTEERKMSNRSYLLLIGRYLSTKACLSRSRLYLQLIQQHRKQKYCIHFCRHALDLQGTLQSSCSTKTLISWSIAVLRLACISTNQESLKAPACSTVFYMHSNVREWVWKGRGLEHSAVTLFAIAEEVRTNRGLLLQWRWLEWSGVCRWDGCCWLMLGRGLRAAEGRGKWEDKSRKQTGCIPKVGGWNTLMYRDSL